MRCTRQKNRKGIVAVKVAFLMVPMLGMLALSVDYGYLLKMRTDLQRAADAAALAGVRDLLPEPDGTQDLNAVTATIRSYADTNTERSGFQVLDADIEIGRYDPTTINSGNVTLLNSGVLDAVRVTLRRDSAANTSVSLFFARALGLNDSGVTATATAVLRKADVLVPGNGLLPIAVHENVWDGLGEGDDFDIYNSGIVDDSGNSIPGNWGTVDIGNENNSTADMSDQIINGLRQADLDALYGDGRIPTDEYIDTGWVFLSQGDTGLSSGLKHAIQTLHGTTTVIPIYDAVVGGGNNAEFRIVGWGTVDVVTSNWQGAKNTHVSLRKTFRYEGYLRPIVDLSDQSGTIEGSFAPPALVQ